jgi:hypothetical protein
MKKGSNNLVIPIKYKNPPIDGFFTQNNMIY